MSQTINLETRTAKEWKPHLEAWKASGLTQKEFCDRNDLKIDQFKSWRKRYLKAARLNPSLKPICVSSEMPRLANAIQVALPSGVRMSIPTNMDSALLKLLLEKLFLPC